MSVLNFVVKYRHPKTGNSYYFKRFKRVDSGILPVGVMSHSIHLPERARFNFLGAWRIKQYLDIAGYQGTVCYKPEA